MSAPGWRQRRRSSLAWAALAGALAVALLALALSTPPAQSAEAQCAATTRVTGQATSLKLDAENRRIGVEATGKAFNRDGTTNFIFPITEGRVNKDQLCGRIVHSYSAGLAFTAGGKRLVFSDFVIDLDQGELYARDVVGRLEGEDRHLPFMRLAITPGDVHTGPGVLLLHDVNVTLTAAAAQALNQKFDTDLFEAGMPMGKTVVGVRTEL